MVDIRELEERDIDIVMEIENLCFVSPWKKEDIFKELHSNQFAHLLVATISGVIVGYVDYWVTFDSATICQIAVHPAYQHQGIGTTLLKEVFSDCYAKRVINITLEVRASNSKAINFYSKYGFNKYLTKEGYYSNGEDAIYMIKEVEING